MAQKLKRPMSFLLALVVAMVFHFPIGITNGITGILDFGLPAKAAETKKSLPEVPKRTPIKLLVLFLKVSFRIVERNSLYNSL